MLKIFIPLIKFRSPLQNLPVTFLEKLLKLPTNILEKLQKFTRILLEKFYKTSNESNYSAHNFYLKKRLMNGKRRDYDEQGSP